MHDDAVTVPRAVPRAVPPVRLTPRPLGSEPQHPDIEDELEEIGFFVAQGLDEDAREALERLRAEHPEHPDLERVREIGGTLVVEPRDETPEEAVGEDVGEDVDAALDSIIADDQPLPLTPEGTVIAPHPSPAAPYAGGGPLENADSLMRELGLDRPRPGRITIVSEDPDRPPPPAPFQEEPPDDTTESGTVITPNPLPPAPYAGPEVAEVRPIRLVMLGDSGGVVDERVLAPGETLEIGRGGEVPWGDDPKLESLHARLEPVAAGLAVEAGDAINGVFRQIDARTLVRDGDAFRVGESLLTFECPNEGPDRGAYGRLVVTEPDGEPRTYAIEGDGLLVGREDVDVSFADDTYVSARHCRISCEGTDVFIEDLRSSNGTHVRLRPGDVAPVGTRLLMGHTQFEIRTV